MFRTTIASREHVNLMVGLTGPSGAGKTYSALQLAYGISGNWEKVVVADTENRSALYYAGERTGPWRHVDFSTDIPNGYHPDNWIRLFDYIEREMPSTEVVVLDSITHEWAGKGGCLELHARLGGQFATWKQVTPLHNRFIDRMRHSKFHVIATMRSKQDYSLEKNDKGKVEPIKVGLGSVQRDGTDYEFGVIFDINMGHLATASKDRTGLYAPRGAFEIGPETGRELLNWARPEVVPAQAVPSQSAKIFDQHDTEQVEKLVSYLNKVESSEFFDAVAQLLEGKPFTPKVVNEIIAEIRLEG